MNETMVLDWIAELDALLPSGVTIYNGQADAIEFNLEEYREYVQRRLVSGEPMDD